MADLDVIEKMIRSVTNERVWQQFHNSKNLAAALSIDAGERTVLHSRRVEISI